MNINYDEIISLANKRKDALKNLELALADISHVIEKLEFAEVWYSNLHKAWTELDTEGRNILPPEVKRLMPYIGNGQPLHKMVYDIYADGKCYGLKVLQAAMNKE